MTFVLVRGTVMTRMGEIAGKTAVVTGATSGIGNAIARLLVAEGANVVAAGRNVERLAELERELGSAVVGARTDVLIEDDIRAVVATAVERFGRLDLAFNVVGGAGRASAIVDTVTADWEAVIQLTLRSAFLGIEYQAKQMISQGGGGSIVNISSLNQLVPLYGSAAYATAKAGVGMLTKNAALELARHRIRVNAVLPGLTDTRPTQRSRKPEIRSAYLERIPMGRSAAPAEIALPALFLASEAASYVTGANLIVDGGWALTGYPDASRWF
jgi:NAD(P)-dependent dehydrogenase (short-subunit alcohol dehydrogenase family)